MSRTARRLAPWWGRTTLAAALSMSLGCAASPGPRSPAGPSAAFLTDREVQVLLRGSVSNAHGTSRFRLALRRRAESFELAATDAFGRGAWMLSVGSREALWVDHRQRLACWLPRAGGLAPLGLAAVPLDSVALILLGRAPVAALEDESEYSDGALRWRCERDAGGKLLSWTLEEDGAARAQWKATPKGWLLTASQSATRIEAQVVAREPLPEGFAPRLLPPAGYGREGCQDAALP